MIDNTKNINLNSISLIGPSMIQIQNNSICIDNKDDRENNLIINKSNQKNNILKLGKDFSKLSHFEARIVRNRKKTQFNHCSVLNEFRKLNNIPTVQLNKKFSEVNNDQDYMQFDNKDNYSNNGIILISHNKEAKIQDENTSKNNNASPSLNNTTITPMLQHLIASNSKKNLPNQRNGGYKTSPILMSNSPLIDDHLSPMQIVRNFNLNPENNFGVVKKLFIYELKMSFLQAKKLCISLDLQGGNSNTKRKPAYYDLFSNYSQIITSTIKTYDKYEDQNIKVNNYLIYKSKLLGKGGYSTVYLCQNILNNCEYAVKITDKNARMNRMKKKYDYVKEEVTILKRLHSRFVVQVYEIIENDKEIFIIMEYLKNNSLFNKIKDLEGFQIWRYFRNIICGVEHCHEIGKIAHRDINVNNLLISSEDILKLSDFGISAIIEDDNDLLPCNSGPSTYTPPEKIYSNSEFYHGKAADMWCIGVTLYHMVYKRPLFANFGDITKENHMNIELPNEDSLDSRITTLISDLLQFDPEKRPTFPDLKKNKWVTHNDEYPLPDIYDEAINYCYNITSKEIGAMFVNHKQTNNNFIN